MTLKKSSQKPEKQRFGCLRCGYVWFTRLTPRYCANCKSSLWNKPRKYFPANSSDIVPTEKRTAATGRAAAKQRPERIRAEKRAELERALRIAKYDGDTIMRAFFDLRDKNLGLQPDKHPLAYQAWQQEARRLTYQQEIADEKIIKAQKALDDFDRETKQNPQNNLVKQFENDIKSLSRAEIADFTPKHSANPAIACHDCGTTDAVFKSALGFHLCPDCENRRQQTIFQI